MLNTALSFLLFLTLTYSMCSQNVTLNLQIEQDSIIHHTNQEFSDYKSARTRLDFKIDSLKRIGFPFLKFNIDETKEVIKAKIQLHQNIEYIYISINQKDAAYIPNEFKPKDSIIQLAYPDIETFLQKTSQKLSKLGNPFATSFLNHISLKNKNSLAAKLKIELKDKRRVNAIKVKGYNKLPKSFITYYSNLKVDDIFIESVIQDKTEKLNNLPFIKVKKPADILFKQDSTEVYLYLEKIQSNTFDGFLGFGSDAESNFNVNGYLNINLINNLNFGEQLDVVYKNDANGQETFDAELSLPFIFNTPLSLETSIRIFRRDSAFSNTTQGLSLKYYLTPNLNVKASAELTNSTNLEPLNTVNTIPIERFKSNFYGLGAEYIKTTNQGIFGEDTFVSLDLLNGERQAIQETNQYKLRLAGQHQIDVGLRHRIYLASETEILISDSFLNNELFRFGGINSIRGFAENSLLASRYSVLKSEYRYLLDSNLYVNSVLDIGNFEDQLNNVNENILGYGIGLGLKSNAGIFKLILANSISNQQDSRLSNSKIHISFNSYF